LTPPALPGSEEIEGSIGDYCFSCPHCRWLSDAVGLVDPDPLALSNKVLEFEENQATKAKFQGLIAMFQKENEVAAR
ncbi:unnamed protein product, partial [Heterosigma akashiwo]